MIAADHKPMDTAPRLSRHQLTLSVICVVSGLIVAGGSAIRAFYPERNVATRHMVQNKSPIHATTKRLVLILVDGLRHDVAFSHKAMPFLNRLKRRGAWGVGTNVNLTLTNLAVINIGTGAPPRITKVLQNFKNSPVQSLSLFTVLRRHGGRIALIGDANFGELFGHEADLVATNKDKGREDLTESDDRSMAWALQALKSRQYAVTTIHFVGVDHAGHKFTPKTEAYRTYVRRTDKLIETLYRTDPGATFLVMSDHGMTDQGTHGGGERECINFPLVFFGSGITSAKLKKPTLSDIAPTVLALFGVPDLGAARGRILDEALALGPLAKIALLQRYQDARLRYLAALAVKYGLPAPPNPLTIKAGTGSPAVLARLQTANQPLNQYISAVVENTAMQRYATIALLLMLAMYAFLSHVSHGTQPPPARSVIPLVWGLAASGIAATFAGLSALSVCLAMVMLLVASSTLLRDPATSRSRMIAAALFLAALGGVLYAGTALFNQFRAERGLTGWITYLPELDRWYMTRLKALFAGVCVVFGLTLGLSRWRRWQSSFTTPIALGVLVGLSMLISVFYWAGNNMARLAIVASTYASVLVFVRARAGDLRIGLWLAGGTAVGVVLLWVIGAFTASWSVRLEHTYRWWFIGSGMLIALYALAILRRRMLDLPRLPVLVLIGVATTLAYAYRLLHWQWMPGATLALAAVALVIAALTHRRDDLHALLPLIFLATYRILSQDVQMVVMTIGALIIAAWSKLRARGHDLDSPLLTALWIVALNLLIFFASGHFWNFSRVEVAIAFVGKPDEINVVWAGCLLFLKYGIPWLLLTNGLLASDTGAQRCAENSRVVIATLFVYVVMIVGLLLPFDTLQQHLEVGSKALPTAVFTYVHSALLLVALGIVQTLSWLSERVARAKLAGVG